MRRFFKSTKASFKPKTKNESFVTEQWGTIVDLGPAIKLTMNGGGSAAEKSRGFRAAGTGRSLFHTHVQYPLPQK